MSPLLLKSTKGFQLTSVKSAVLPCTQNIPYSTCSPTACIDSSGLDGTPPDTEYDDLISDRQPKLLKWSEIPFTSVTEELNAIDEYVKEEDIPDDDAWPKFLRGAAYEYWGQPKLALAQLGKIQHAAGLMRVPNLWERRAYNSFKVGDLAAANAYFDVALRTHLEALGNELHFSHWFNTNFADYVPKRNGPSSAIQRGVCKYCVGMYSEARQGLVSGLATKALGSRHGVLWLIASAARASGSPLMPNADKPIVKPWVESSSKDEVLTSLLQLFVDTTSLDRPPIDGLLKSLESDARSLEADDDALTICIYLALYYDSLRKNDAKRDLWLDQVHRMQGPSSQTDTLNYVYYAALYRLGAAPVKADDQEP